MIVRIYQVAVCVARHKLFIINKLTKHIANAVSLLIPYLVYNLNSVGTVYSKQQTL